MTVNEPVKVSKQTIGNPHAILPLQRKLFISLTVYKFDYTLRQKKNKYWIWKGGEVYVEK